MRAAEVKVGQHLYQGNSPKWREYQEYEDGEVLVVDTRPTWLYDSWANFRADHSEVLQDGTRVTLPGCITLGNGTGILVHRIIGGVVRGQFHVTMLQHLRGHVVACLQDIAGVQEAKRIQNEKDHDQFLVHKALSGDLVVALRQHGIIVSGWEQYSSTVYGVEMDEGNTRKLVGLLQRAVDCELDMTVK
jgi:hypothetical protein